MIFFSMNPTISSRLTNAEEFFAYLIAFPAFNSLQRSPGVLPKAVCVHGDVPPVRGR